MEPTLERLQGAMKFSLLMWALYWPLGGLALLIGGMADPVSLLVVAATLGMLAFLVVSGVLRSDNLGKARRFAAERPMYILGGIVLAILLGSVLDFLTNLGLLVFSALYLASLVLVAARLRDHLQATGQGVIQSRADQLYILIGLTTILALPVLADMALQALGGGSIGSPSAAVAITNLFLIAYPPLLMVAAKPFRAPLEVPAALRQAFAAPSPQAGANSAAPAPTPASPAAFAPAGATEAPTQGASRARAAKAPVNVVAEQA